MIKSENFGPEIFADLTSSLPISETTEPFLKNLDKKSIANLC